MPQTSFLSAPLTALLDPTADFLQDDLLSLARRQLKTFSETSLDLELTAYLGCAHHSRTPGRQGYRNGYYTRDLVTGFGVLDDLRVPRDGVDGCGVALLGGNTPEFLAVFRGATWSGRYCTSMSWRWTPDDVAYVAGVHPEGDRGTEWGSGVFVAYAEPVIVDTIFANGFDG